jgi:hypothetical protein
MSCLVVMCPPFPHTCFTAKWTGPTPLAALPVAGCGRTCQAQAITNTAPPPLQVGLSLPPRHAHPPLCCCPFLHLLPFFLCPVWPVAEPLDRVLCCTACLPFRL